MKRTNQSNISVNSVRQLTTEQRKCGAWKQLPPCCSVHVPSCVLSALTHAFTCSAAMGLALVRCNDQGWPGPQSSEVYFSRLCRLVFICFLAIFGRHYLSFFRRLQRSIWLPQFRAKFMPCLYIFYYCPLEFTVTLRSKLLLSNYASNEVNVLAIHIFCKQEIRTSERVKQTIFRKRLVPHQKAACAVEYQNILALHQIRQSGS